MRNVSGRKVLNAAKQIFCFFHIKSSISATSHPGSSCPEGWVRHVPKSPEGYCLFSTQTERNFTVFRAVPVTLWVGNYSQDVTHLPFLLQVISGHKGIPTFCSIWYPFPGAVFTEVLLLLFCLQYILSFAHDPKPQHLMCPILPVCWHWRPQKQFSGSK